jgi:hypothetical protein
MRKYAVMESLWQVGFLTASIISLTQFDSIEGVGFGFMALYVILFFYTLHYARTYHAFAFPNRVVTTWLLGLGLIILASAMTWSSGDIDWIVVLFWIPVLIAFMAMALTLDERRQLRIWVARRE